MRTGNPMDGAYFFLLFAPFLLSIWAGNLLRKKITGLLLSDLFWSHNLSVFFGISIQIIIVIFGALTGYFLIIFFQMQN